MRYGGRDLSRKIRGEILRRTPPRMPQDLLWRPIWCQICPKLARTGFRSQLVHFCPGPGPGYFLYIIIKYVLCIIIKYSLCIIFQYSICIIIRYSLCIIFQYSICILIRYSLCIIFQYSICIIIRYSLCIIFPGYPGYLCILNRNPVHFRVSRVSLSCSAILWTILHCIDPQRE